MKWVRLNEIKRKFGLPTKNIREAAKRGEFAACKLSDGETAPLMVEEDSFLKWLESRFYKPLK